MSVPLTAISQLGDGEFSSWPHTVPPVGTLVSARRLRMHRVLSLPSGRRRRASLIPGTLAAAILLAACGSAAADNQVASLSGGSTATGDTTSTTLSQAETQQAMLDYTACMRDSGIDMADPTFDANGNIQGGFGRGSSSVDPRSEEFQAAQKACGDKLAGIQFGGPGGGRGFDRTAIQDAFNSFTACLRDQGMQVDDITLGDGPGAGGPGGGPPASDGATAGSRDGAPGGFTGGPPPGGADGNNGGPGAGGFNPTDRIIERLDLDNSDPTVAAAVEACQPALEQAFADRSGSTSTSSGA